MANRLASALPSSLIAEQLQVVCKSQLTSLPINCFLGVCVALILRPEIDGRTLGWWLVTLFVVNIVRFAIVIRHRRKLTDPGLTHGTLLFHGFSAFLCGLIWAAIPAFMFRLESASAPAVIFILCGITAGASVMSGTYALCGIAFVCPIMTSMVIKLIISGNEASYLLPIAAICYMGMMVQSLRQSEGTFVKAILLNLKAAALVTSLDREHTSAEAAAKRFYRLANHDTLTGLGNRDAFSSYLTECLSTSQADDTEFGLILIDLDHFKSINDTLGHSVGDEVLKEAAHRLNSFLEGDHLVARLGGDEFAILYHRWANAKTGPSLAAEIEDYAALILDAVSGTFDIGDHQVSIELSIGVAIFPGDGTTTEKLLANAELALYDAKDGGRQRWRRFNATLLSEATLARDIERDLLVALADGSVQVFYQPQITLREDRVTGIEALLRWRHPIHGWISPPSIVATARRLRMSEGLTGYVLAHACRQIRRLGEAGYTDMLVAVNVSPGELDDYDFTALVRRSLEQYGVEPQCLEVEITEEAFAGVATLATLSALSDLGVRLAIDDFGTGCSALAYLRTMNVNRIKIDRSFVTGLSARKGDRILVQAILGIGKSFGMEVVAEGVETIEDVRQLNAFQCEVVQGFHFAEALSESDLKTWLEARSISHRSSNIASWNAASPDRAVTQDAAVAA